jgi:hypothetical protein
LQWKCCKCDKRVLRTVFIAGFDTNVQDFNPYRPPQSHVSDPVQAFAPLPPARIVPMASALGWFRAGMQLLLRQPGVWLMMGALYFAFLLLLDAIPVLGPTLQHALAAVIEGGMMLACRRAQSDKIGIGDFFSGFRQAFQPLLVLGILTLLTLAAGALAAASMEGESGLRRVLFGERASLRLSTVVAIDIARLLAGLPFAFATALVVFHGLNAFTAFKQSARAAFANLPALLTASAMIFALIWVALFTLGFLLIALLPWMLTTSYAAYRDVFAAGDAPKA